MENKRQDYEPGGVVELDKTKSHVDVDDLDVNNENREQLSMLIHNKEEDLHGNREKAHNL